MSNEDWMLEWIQELVRSGMPVENAIVAFKSKIGDVDPIDETADPKTGEGLMVIQQ